MNESVTSPTTRRDQHELLHLGEIFNALAKIVAMDRRESFEICELGCTTGWLSNELTALCRVTGVDPDAERIAQARQQYPNVAFEAGDLIAWAPQRAFDLVVSSEVLEHLTEKSRYVDTLKRITKPGGWVLITTPNQKLKSYWDAAEMGEGLYEDWLTPKALRALLTDFEIVQHGTFLYDFAYTGAYRFFNAKKLRAVLTYCKVAPLYDGLWHMLGLGLYQIVLCRRK
jgi:2-polyprenyl-3-methyl-5-hydroxy-6-metoxy-1,4-benzoquinol methylase